jgi:L,D-transpeptidase ErfK/SrfK
MKSALTASVALLMFAAGGCVFVPLTEVGESASYRSEPEAVGPDPAAPRLAALDTRHYRGIAGTAEVVGEMQVLFTRHENTFSAIAREYDLGYEELRRANPGVDHWLPGEETPVYLPTQAILPDAPRAGIVINLPSMRLFYFSDHEKRAGEAQPVAMSVTSHPIGIGRQGWATPVGSAKVTQKARDPVWYVPASVRKEHAERGDPLPSIVPAGPDNPLGRHAIALSMPGYLLHGTNKPAGVGMRVSHGCIRLYPEDIEALFDRIAAGTEVHIVNQPVLAGWRDGELYLQVHQPLDEDERDLAEEVEKVLSAAIKRAGNEQQVQLKRDAIVTVLAEQRGIPFPVGTASASFGRYLASARIVENTTPSSRSETAALLD